MIHRKQIAAIFLALAVTTECSIAADPQTLPSATQPAVAAEMSNEALKPAPNEMLSEVQAKLHEIRSLEADFEEEVYPKNSKTPFRFTGHLAVKEPNRVIWVVKTPFRSAIRVLGEELRMWDQNMPKDKPQVINLAGNATYKATAQQTRDWAGGNFKALSESYDVFVVKDSPLSLRFVPKPGTGLVNVFENVVLTLTDDRSSIGQIVYHRSSGEIYVLTLKASRVNTPIKPEMWDFPPK